jgi:hypothetical protein
MRYAELPLAVVAAAACLFIPAAAVTVTVPSVRQDTEMSLGASAVYLSVFAMAASAVFRVAGFQLFARLGWLGASICAAAASVLLVRDPAILPAIGYGLAAGVLGALVILAGFVAGNTVGTYVWFPLRRRPLGSLPPSAAVAARLWFLVDVFEDVGGSWRQPSKRRELLVWIRVTGFWLETRLRLATWMAGYRGPEFEEASQRYRRAAGYVRSKAWHVMDAGDHATLERISKELAATAVSVARGRWEPVPELPQPTRASRMMTMARRLVAPSALATTAFALPHLPGVTLSGSALTSFQVALLVASALTLTPLDHSSRERVLGAFSNEHRHT